MQHTNTSSMSGDSTTSLFCPRSGHAVAHDEEGRAFERLGNAQVQIWRTGSSRGLSFQGRVGDVAISGPKCSDLQSISPKFSRLWRARGQLDYLFQNAPPRRRATSGADPLRIGRGRAAAAPGAGRRSDSRAPSSERDTKEIHRGAGGYGEMA